MADDLGGKAMTAVRDRRGLHADSLAGKPASQTRLTWQRHPDASSPVFGEASNMILAMDLLRWQTISLQVSLCTETKLTVCRVGNNE
jgi:hypothetical protein